MKKQENKALDLEQEIELWKKEYGSVYQTTIADEKIIWRTLKRSEYIQLMTGEYNENEDLAYFERQEAAAKLVMLYPKNTEEIIEDFAGIAEIISSECMIKSGFGSSYTEAL